MANSGPVQVKLELGHRAQFRKKPTVEGFTHDWMVFVRGPEHSNIQHFVEKVVFHLHESFPKPKRVCKDPPYKVEESGYAGFILPIEVYFRNKEEPKKVRFDYDLFLHLEGHPPVNHLRCEKLTFNNPTDEFRRKLLRAGGQRDPHKRTSEDSKVRFARWRRRSQTGKSLLIVSRQVMVMQEGSASLFGPHMKLPTLPDNSLGATFSEPRKTKSSHGIKDGSKVGDPTLLTTATSSNSSSFSKAHKPSKDHKEKPPKDLKETKSAFRDSCWESSKSAKEPPRKPKENQPLRNSNPKMGFKEPKFLSHRNQGSAKRPPAPDGDNHQTKKRKRAFGDLSGKPASGSEIQHSDKKLLKMRSGKVHAEGDDAAHRKGPPLPPFQEVADPNDSDMESAKSDSEQPSPVSTSSSSGFAPTHHRRQVLGPLQSVMRDFHSDDNDDDSGDDDDQDLDSDADRPPHPQRRISLSEGSESDGSAPTPPPRGELPGLLKTTNNQTPNNKQDRNKNLDCDKAYLDELVELHKRLMTLREGHILQQIVNLIEETGHFHITNTTFDFDLCSLDRSTVRKLQSYLENSGLF
ncbi:protein AF-9 [Stigmatopora argus]